MKELKIGEEIHIRCVEGGNCELCCLWRTHCCSPRYCTSYEREDHKAVHFEIVEKPTEEDYTKEMRQLNEEWQENLKIQRQMMIDKACEWIDEYFPTRGNGETTFSSIEDVKECFRKAMEK